MANTLRGLSLALMLAFPVLVLAWAVGALARTGPATGHEAPAVAPTVALRAPTLLPTPQHALDGAQPAAISTAGPGAPVAPPTVAAPTRPAVASQTAGQPNAVVANTGGIGLRLREAPVDGRQVGTLLEGQRVTVLERTSTPAGEWVRVRTPDGLEGWATGRGIRGT